ncbi:ferritin-like domain-containing protein [Georhizobium sp. MAB10]|uniref:ferritin-like domain-containing protein n=1 Tax=Georhizobium sp. MAB10 TaxID=3028319 RepID=UPI003855AEA9
MAGTNDVRSIFIVGLRNAHAMENQALSIMQPQVKRIEHYPEVGQRLQEHVRETEAQQQRLETVLGQFDEGHSSLKDMALSMVGSMAALAHSAADDEILKNSFANFAFENFEIAAYKSLRTLAELGGFQSAIAVIEQNLAEEEAMARWLEEHLDSTTRRYASLSASGETAKI